MIPIRDTVKSRTFPYINLAIIIINVLIFLAEISLNNSQLTELFYRTGIVPSMFFAATGEGNYLGAVVPLITATFMHGGWLHIVSNMLFLWVFGDNIEDRIGHFKYFVFYVLVGMTGNISQVMANPASTVPVIGASGAVAGILGAYYLSFPRSRILALIPIFFFFTFLEVRASLFIILWFLLQVFNGVFSLGVVGNSVAWWAHIGGFLGGYFLIRFFPQQNKLIYVE
ncbi:MAG: rhomboid family intramembrane serine protease [Peptococcaceae bacterium]